METNTRSWISRGLKIRFIDANAPAELARNTPDCQANQPRAAAAPWVSLPLSGGQALRWSRQTLEISWDRPRRLRGLRLDFLTMRQPEVQVPDLSDIALRQWNAASRRWMPVRTQLAYDDSRRYGLARFLDSGFIALICRFTAPLDGGLLRIRVGHPPRQCALRHVQAWDRPPPAAPAASGRLGYCRRDHEQYAEFVRQAYPALAEEVRRCPAETALEFFRQRLQPYHGRALLGLKDDPVETGIDWDHTVMEELRPIMGRQPCTPLIVAFWSGQPPRAPGGPPPNARRALLHGWMPGVATAWHDRGIAYRLTTFVQPPAGRGGQSFTRIRCELANRTRRDGMAHLTLAVAALYKLQPYTWHLKQLDLHRRGNALRDSAGAPVMQIPPGGRFSPGLENILHYRRRLPAGAARSLEFIVRRWTPELPRPAPARPGPYHRAADAFRQYWRDRLADGASIAVPDRALNALWKNLLAQFFITAEGNRLPYGAFPSRYNGAVFGIEEAWIMQALATAGFGGDALRYFANTYLTETHLAKSNYHHQYRAGNTLACARALLQLTDDQDRLAGIRERLRAEADWIVRARRRTMRTFAGKQPLHWGLLPHHYYGGDVHKPAYSLYPNAVCWRGLRDFGLILRTLGQPDAERYLHESALYRTRIQDVIATMIRRRPGEAFLSMKLYWPKSTPYSPVFWPLFLSMFLETGILDLAGRDVRGLLAFLAKHGHTLAGVPVLYPMRLDPVYGLGTALAQLQAGNVGEYLKTVAAYRSFLLDPHFHTTPESGDLCLRADDTAWEIRSEENTWRHWMNPSSPLTAGAAVLFLLLRNMLVTELRDASGLADGRLLIMPACPLAWQQNDGRVAIARMATEYGEIGYDFVKHGRHCRLRIPRMPTRGCRAIGIRLRTMTAGVKVTLTVNGRRTVAAVDAGQRLWFPVDGRPLEADWPAI